MLFFINGLVLDKRMLLCFESLLLFYMNTAEAPGGNLTNGWKSRGH